jgi:NADH:ubiquinone oxidoreductase subunit E
MALLRRCSLGNCAIGPALMIDGELHGRMTVTRVDDLVDALRRRKPT